MKTREDIETIGFKVIAQTRMSETTVKYSAHYVGGMTKRFMAHGEAAEPDLAMDSLYRACLAKAAQKGVK